MDCHRPTVEGDKDQTMFAEHSQENRVLGNSMLCNVNDLKANLASSGILFYGHSFPGQQSIQAEHRRIDGIGGACNFLGNVMVTQPVIHHRKHSPYRRG